MREKLKGKKFFVTSIIFICLAMAFFVAWLMIHPYETNGIDRAYLSWAPYVDVSEDLRYAAFNDSCEQIYFVDHTDDSVCYILDQRNIPVKNAYLSYICIGNDNTLYVDVVEKNDQKHGNLSEHILAYDTAGKLVKEYIISEDRNPNGYVRVHGLRADGENIRFIQTCEDGYMICCLNPKKDSIETVAKFIRDTTDEIAFATYDHGSYIVSFTDGSVYEANPDGTENFIDRFGFSVDGSEEDGYYAGFFTRLDDTYYFMDKMYLDAIYSYKDGEIAPAYTIEEIYGMEGASEEELQKFYETAVDYCFTELSTHGDILLFSSRGNLYAQKDDKLHAILGSEEGFKLASSYAVSNLLKKSFPYVFCILGGIGLLLFLIFIVKYYFLVISKMLLIMVPFTIVVFGIITQIVINHAGNIYKEGEKAKLVSISSLIASALDGDELKQLNDLEDISNGNVEKLNERLEKIIDSQTVLTGKINISIYSYGEDGVHYLLSCNPADEPAYLVTYMYFFEDDIKEKRVGDSNTYELGSKDQGYEYTDALTYIYDSDNEIVAFVDVYEEIENINDNIKALQKIIILIAVIFTVVIIGAIIVISRYITKNLNHTSHVVEKISAGDLDARVKKITSDEIGTVGRGVNQMAEQLKMLFEEQEEFSRQAIETLVGTIDAKDKYTNGHSIRVAQYSQKIAERLGKSEEEQKQIYYSGLLHDIGKIGVPDNIINKTTRLTDEEFYTIKTHPEIGYDILGKLSKLENISIGAYAHHERIDGRGYPRGLKGEEIPEIARIIGVADTYDAMTSNRSYRRKMAQEKVRSELENAKGTQLDASFAQIMLDIDLEMYPNGYPQTEGTDNKE